MISIAFTPYLASRRDLIVGAISVMSTAASMTSGTSMVFASDTHTQRPRAEQEFR
jgi:hypothetical protein